MLDFEEAFDKTDRSMLSRRLESKFLYLCQIYVQLTNCCITINTVLSDWLPLDPSLKQGDNLSPTLWNIFSNDLIKEIKELNIGIPIENDLMMSIPLYADAMGLLAENEKDLQTRFDKLNEYCFK